VHGISLGSRYHDVSYVIAYGNSATDGGGAGVEVGSAHTNLSHVLSYDNYYGVLVNELSEDVNIDDVVAYGNYEGGVALYGLYASTVRRAISFDNGYGLLVRDDSYDVLIEQSRLFGNAQSGFDSYSYSGHAPHDILLRSSAIYDNEKSGIWVEQGDRITIRNNSLYGNGVDFDISDSANDILLEGNALG
jgi:hypothetical protein